MDAVAAEHRDGTTAGFTRRLPVVDDDKRLCGMITEADIARHLPQDTTGEMVGAIAAAQPQHF